MKKKEDEKFGQAGGQQELQDEKQESKMPLAILRDQCMRLYSVTSSTFAGATAGIPDGEYTVAEVRRMIDAWLKKEVR